jgi:hypothetical protein
MSYPQTNLRQLLDVEHFAVDNIDLHAHRLECNKFLLIVKASVLPFVSHRHSSIRMEAASDNFIKAIYYVTIQFNLFISVYLGNPINYVSL